jgi:FKBP-type peptidyl-prolyl cis-trans isomerase FklB
MNAAAQLEKHSLEVNPASYYQGLRDALSGRSTLLSPQRALEIVRTKQKELGDSARADKSRARQLSAQENKKAGEAFLALNRSRPGVTTLPSGLQYKILREGFGSRPASNDVVVCAFQGALVDGRVFDSSARQGKPTVLPLNRTLRGWREALELMPAGSKWQIVIPPSLAYGARSSRRGGIPPNSVLVFELELQSVQERPAASQPTVAHSETDADDLDSNYEPRAAN